MQRVALAAAAAPRPRYLLLDEPASHLDAPSRAELLAWTRAYVEREGAAVVWTECEAELLGAADRVLDLGGAAPSIGTAAPVVAGPAGPVAHVGAAGLARWRGSGLALTLDGGAGRPPRTLWGGLDLDIRAGQIWVITGPNGRGKTALLETLAGWREPTAGRLDRPPVHDLALVAQFPEYQLFAPTVGEEVGFALRHRRVKDGGRPPKAIADAVARALAWVGLDPAKDADRSPESLSLGERRRLAIAGVLIAEPVALLLDEPTAGLDAAARAKVLAALAEAAGRGAAVVVATHDAAIARPLLASRIELPDFPRGTA
jgi:energy-coupling factor transport system ATP-binding protein